MVHPNTPTPQQWARIIRPTPKLELPAGVSAHLLREVNVVLVDEDLFDPRDARLVRQLLSMDSEFMGEVA